MRPLSFLHTAPSNATLFDELWRKQAPNHPVKHLVNEALLASALHSGGVTDTLREALGAEIDGAFQEEPGLLVCTCSTLGAAAEDLGGEKGLPVMRIDRPMAEKAIETGPRVLVAACVATTMGPTTDLVNSIAREKKQEIEISTLLLDELWSLFQSGGGAAYEKAIAEALGQTDLTGIDVIVLSQASMAGAQRHCDNIAVPVLASPALGVAAAFRMVNP